MNEEPRQPQTEEEGDPIERVIPYKNAAALFAYYCAVFSVIPCLGLMLGPVAVILGIVGLVQKKNNPAIRGGAHAWTGIILGGLTFLVNLGTILFLLMNVVPPG